MSKLNKIITNRPVVLTEEEVNNLSETLSAVRTAGGGEGGHLYTGDNKYIGVDNGNYKIKFLDNAAQKLESISSKLDKTEAANTYLTSANAQTLYQTKEAMSAYATTAYVNGVTGSIYYTSILGLVDALSAKQDTLTFGYDETDAISSINSYKLAGAGGVTGDYYSASNPSGFINSTQAETQILEKHYLTESSGDLLYVPIPEGLSEGQYYAMTTSGWEIIQGAGDVSGITTVSHDNTLTGNGNQQMLGVDFTKVQTKLSDAEIQNIIDVTTLKTASSTWDNVSAKLNTTDFNTYTATTAPATYQPIGNYLSSNALEGYATTALLDTISSKIETDIPTTVAQLTDSGNYYTKSETSGASELSTEFAKYQPKGNYLVADDITGKLDKSIYANASGNWEASYNVLTAYSAAGTWLTEHQSLANYYTKSETSGTEQLSTEFGKYLTTAQYQTDSATFALKTDLNGLVNSASVTTNDNYVMTNSGWKVLTLPGGGMTQVYHDTTLTGDGNSNDNQLGVKWETLSSNTIAYSNSAFNLTNGTSVSSFDQISAAIDSRYSKSSSDGRYLQKSLDDTLTGDGTSNKKLGVAWSALSGNKIDSAKSADSAVYLTNGTNYSGFNDITGAINNKLNTNAIKTSAIGNTTYITAINTGSNDIPVKDTNFWDVNTTASTTAGNDNWQHYVTTSNTFNYYKMIVHPSGTTADNSWNNDNIIHIILEE